MYVCLYICIYASIWKKVHSTDCKDTMKIMNNLTFTIHYNDIGYNNIEQGPTEKKIVIFI